MKIQDYVDFCSNNNYLFPFNDLLDNANSFLENGHCTITVRNYDSSILLDKFAAIILQIWREKSIRAQFTTEEKLAGIEVLHKLKKLYGGLNGKMKPIHPVIAEINNIRDMTLDVTKSFAQREAAKLETGEESSDESCSILESAQRSSSPSLNKNKGWEYTLLPTFEKV